MVSPIMVREDLAGSKIIMLGFNFVAKILIRVVELPFVSPGRSAVSNDSSRMTGSSKDVISFKT